MVDISILNKRLSAKGTVIFNRSCHLLARLINSVNLSRFHLPTLFIAIVLEALQKGDNSKLIRATVERLKQICKGASMKNQLDKVNSESS